MYNKGELKMQDPTRRDDRFWHFSESISKIIIKDITNPVLNFFKQTANGATEGCHK